MRSLLFSAFFGLILALTAPFAAAAQQAEIEGTITQQFEAFKADDFDGAFEFASPSLQLTFRNAENFRRMVTTGYPMVWRPAEVRYLELREIAGAMWQKVRITDQKGMIHVLDYQMVQTEDGWRIAGVQILDAPAVSA